MPSPSELYEKLYFHEIEAREQFNNRLQVPLSLLIVLAGGFAFLLQSFDRTLSTTVWYAFVALLILSGASIAASAFYFVRAAWGHNYSFVPYPEDTQRHRSELAKTYSAYDEKYKTRWADQHFESYLENYFILAATANGKVNDKRSLSLHRTMMFAVVATGLSVAAFTCFVLGDLNRAEPIRVLMTDAVDVRGVPDTVFVVPATNTADSATRTSSSLGSPNASVPKETTDAAARAAATASPAAATTDAADKRGGKNSATAAAASKGKP